MFDKRELAILIWLVVLLIWGFTSKKLRPAFASTARAFLTPKVFGVLLAMAIYVSGVVYLLWLVKVWAVEVLGATIFWFFGPAVVLLFKVSDQKGESRLLRRTLLGLFSFTVVFEFLVNVHVLALVAEVALVPLLVLLGGTVAYAGSKPEYRQVRSFLTALTLLVGISFLSYGLDRIVRNPGEFASLGTARDFLVPLLLTVGLLPFLYLAAVVFSYGVMLAMLSWKLGESSLYQYARRRAIRAAKLRLSTVRRFATAYPAALIRSSSRQDVDRAAARIKQAPARRASARE